MLCWGPYRGPRGSGARADREGGSMNRLRNDLEARRPYLDQDFSDAEYERRLAVVRAGMARENLEALIVYCGIGSYANVRWLTNFQPIYGSAFVIVRADGGIAVATD